MGAGVSDTSVLRQDYDPTRPAFERRGQDATKVPCPSCGQIHWIGDCGERCARRLLRGPPNDCGWPEHMHPNKRPAAASVRPADLHMPHRVERRSRVMPASLERREGARR